MGGSESKERAGDGDVIDGLFNAVAFAQCCGPVSSASTTHMVTPQAQSLMAKRRNKPDDVERQLVVGLAKRPDITNSISKGGGVSGVKLPEDKHEMYFAMVDQGQAELLDLFLIKHKNLFDVNQVNMSGDSALHIAARRSKIQVVKVLLRHGAARKRNRAGRMPEEEARDHGNSFIAKLPGTKRGNAPE
ncbi:hypothetical protein T484DRAFT_1798109 [Baffinella frigidus]|nr:hypothetical protein T484DRAFT_1798109 [Cryptophyta sp. CCMP2293]